MNILIVDDDQIKTENIINVLSEYTLAKIKLNKAEDIAGGISYLLEKKYEILILDLNLPLRKGEKQKKNGGLKILKELNRNPKLFKPTCILGLTSHEDLKFEHGHLFDIEGWTLLVLKNGDFSWEDAIINKIDYIFKQSMQKHNDVKNILFLSASPKDESRLRVDEECKKIENGLAKSSERDSLCFIPKFAIDFEGASEAILKIEPVIVHFSGHGNIEGVAFENEAGVSKLIKKESLFRLFELYKDKLECIVLNACESQELAIDFSNLGLYVIGMNDSISDIGAISFSVGFYQAIGGGKDVMFAFKLGLAHLSAGSSKETNIPKLWLNGIEQ